MAKRKQKKSITKEGLVDKLVKDLEGDYSASRSGSRFIIKTPYKVLSPTAYLDKVKDLVGAYSDEENKCFYRNMVYITTSVLIRLSEK